MPVISLLVAVLFAYLAFCAVYLTVFAVAGRCWRSDDRPLAGAPARYRRMAVLIPAYKEDAIIEGSIRTNLRQTYPRDRYDLIVIADSFQPETLQRLGRLPVQVVEVSFELSTVSKAIHAALNRLSADRYDIAVVADADNHLAPDFLMRINAAFEQGWRAVQGHRLAKNTNTSVAVLDAISEELNNTIYRRGNRAFGLSSSIIGSGMAIEFGLMKAGMDNLVTVGGFDKELEMNLLLAGHTVGYLEDARIYDEKVANAAVFEKQRTRWIAAQWDFLRLYFGVGMRELRHGRLTSATKIIQTMILPKVLLLAVLALCFGVGLFGPAAWFWAVPGGLLLTLGMGIVIAVPPYLWHRITLNELLLVPLIGIRFVRSVLNIRKAGQSFIHTPHGDAVTPD